MPVGEGQQAVFFRSDMVVNAVPEFPPGGREVRAHRDKGLGSGAGLVEQVLECRGRFSNVRVVIGEFGDFQVRCGQQRRERRVENFFFFVEVGGEVFLDFSKRPGQGKQPFALRIA